MQEVYQKWVNAERIDNDENKDPFWDPPEVWCGVVWCAWYVVMYVNTLIVISSKESLLTTVATN